MTTAYEIGNAAIDAVADLAKRLLAAEHECARLRLHLSRGGEARTIDKYNEERVAYQVEIESLTAAIRTRDDIIRQQGLGEYHKVIDAAYAFANAWSERTQTGAAGDKLTEVVMKLRSKLSEDHIDFVVPTS